jgi:hypothetical protein
MKCSLKLHKCFTNNDFKAEAGGSGVQGQPGLDGENLSQNKKQKKPKH